MDTQLTAALAPKYRKGNRYDLENSKTTAPSNNSDFYHESSKQHKGRISTYDKIVQELAKDENKSIGKPLFSILGGGDSNVIKTSTSPGKNVGGTLTLYPSGGIHFQNFKPSFRIDLQHKSSELSLESKAISNRGSPPSTVSPPQLLDFVEKFNKQEDENLSPDDFLDYRDSQARELPPESDSEMVIQDDLVNNKKTNYELSISIGNSSHCIDNQSSCNESSEDENVHPQTLTELVSPLPAISSTSEISGLKEEIESTVTFNNTDIPTITFKEAIPNIAISSVLDNQSTFDLISRVRSFSGSSFGRAPESSELLDREHIISVSPQNSIANAVSWKSDDTINLLTPKNSTSINQNPPTRERKLSESLLGFFTGIFGNSPSQSVSERSENLKEVAEMSMLFRY